MAERRVIQRLSWVLIAVFCGLIVPRGLFHTHHHHHEQGEGIVAHLHDHDCAACDHYFSKNFIDSDANPVILKHEVNSDVQDHHVEAIVLTIAAIANRGPPGIL